MVCCKTGTTGVDLGENEVACSQVTLVYTQECNHPAVLASQVNHGITICIIADGEGVAGYTIKSISCWIYHQKPTSQSYRHYHHRRQC